MKKVIFKYSIDTGLNKITMPENAEPLYVAMQHDRLYLWAMVDQQRRPVDRFFQVYGTGWEMDAEPGEYIGTAITEHGTFVWHVFEEV